MDSRLWQDPTGVRRFCDQRVQEAIDKALKGVKGKALVFETDLDGNGIRSVVAFHEPGGWSIGVVGEVDAKRDWGVGVRVAKVWL